MGADNYSFACHVIVSYLHNFVRSYLRQTFSGDGFHGPELSANNCLTIRISRKQTPSICKKNFCFPLLSPYVIKSRFSSTKPNWSIWELLRVIMQFFILHNTEKSTRASDLLNIASFWCTRTCCLGTTKLLNQYLYVLEDSCKCPDWIYIDYSLQIENICAAPCVCFKWAAPLTTESSNVFQYVTRVIPLYIWERW